MKIKVPKQRLFADSFFTIFSHKLDQGQGFLLRPWIEHKPLYWGPKLRFLESSVEFEPIFIWRCSSKCLSYDCLQTHFWQFFLINSAKGKYFDYVPGLSRYRFIGAQSLNFLESFIQFKRIFIWRCSLKCLNDDCLQTHFDIFFLISYTKGKYSDYVSGLTRYRSIGAQSLNFLESFVEF